MKWILFVLSVMGLFVANNALFWVPGKYDWFNFVAAGIAMAIAAISAWFSSKRFAGYTFSGQVSLRKVALAPPAVIWVFVTVLFLFGGLMKVIAYFVYH